jgi:hypothetical protein
MRAYRADAAIRAGHAQEAISWAESAVESARETRQKPSQADAHRILGWARYSTHPEQRDEAEADFRSALDLHRQTRSKPYIIRTLFEFSDFLRLVGDEPAALATEAEALEISGNAQRNTLPLPFPLARSGD